MSGLFGYYSSVPNHQKIVEVAQTIGYSIKEVKASEKSLVCLLDTTSKSSDHIQIDSAVGDYIVFCGKIYNEDVTDPRRYLLDAYQKADFEKLQRLNGSFIAAIYDHTTEKLTIINDRFGSKKLFYSTENDHTFFSPKITPLMRLIKEKKIRKDALLDFFIFGYYLGDKTFDENIHQLPPASILEIANQTKTVKKYWTYQYDGKYDTRDADQLTEELGRLWQKAMDRRIKKNEKIIIEISGGLDSRAVLAAALKTTPKENILLYTFGDERSYDCEIGKTIAHTLGIQHIFLPAKKTDFAEQYSKSFHDAEGMIDATPYSSLQIDQSLRSFSQKIFNGFMGGEIMGPLIFSKIDALRLQTEAEYQKVKDILLDHHRFNDVQTIRQLFNPAYMKGLDVLSSFDRSVEDLQKISIGQLPNYCAKWLYMNESDKYTSFCNFRFDVLFEYVKPFLDTDLVDFLLRVPPELRKEKKLYKQMLVKQYSELFKLPTKNNLGLPLRTNHIKLNVKRVLWYSQRKLNSLSNHLVHHRLFFNKNQNYLDYDDLLRTNEHYQMFMKTMVEKVKKREFFDPEYIESLWKLHLSGRKNSAMIFGLLATVELILEEFYDRPSSV